MAIHTQAVGLNTRVITRMRRRTATQRFEVVSFSAIVTLQTIEFEIAMNSSGQEVCTTLVTQTAGQTLLVALQNLDCKRILQLRQGGKQKPDHSP